MSHLRKKEIETWMMRKVKENKIDDLVMKYFHLAQDKTEVF